MKAWLRIVLAGAFAGALLGQQDPNSYMLEGSTEPVLYRAPGFASALPPGSRTFHDPKELMKGLKRLPAGSRLTWVPSTPKRLDEHGEPILMAPTVLSALQLFCEEHGISFRVWFYVDPKWSISPIF